MTPSQAILSVAVALVMGWFAAGIIWNIRRGSALLKWMQAGLPRLGPRTTLRWLGSSAVQLGIEKAKPPFRRVEIVLALEPRDVPWFWLIARAQGRRDVVILRAQLASAPALEYDLLAPGSWSERTLSQRGRVQTWASEPLEGLTFTAPAATHALSRTAAPSALQAARQVQSPVWRLSSRREYPQLELHVPFPDPRTASAVGFFTALGSLAEQMGKR